MLSKVHLPASAAEAAGLLRDGGWLLGGGTVVMPRVNTGAVPVEQLISLRRAGLNGIRVEHGTVSVGAATTLATLGTRTGLEFLRPVIRSIASPPVRNLATVGGNLVVSQPYGDLAVALLALDARVDVVSADGVREVPVGELAVGPADVLATVHFERPNGTWHYRKAMRRRYNSASIVTVAAAITVEDGLVRHARIALGGVAPRPVRAVAAENALLGRRLEWSTVESAAEAAREGVEPPDDAYASAWYRGRVLPVHVRRALLDEE